MPAVIPKLLANNFHFSLQITQTTQLSSHYDGFFYYFFNYFFHFKRQEIKGRPILFYCNNLRTKMLDTKSSI